MNNQDKINPEWLYSYENKLKTLQGINQAVIIVQQDTDLQGLDTIPVMHLVPNLQPQTEVLESDTDIVSFFKEPGDKDRSAYTLAIRHGGVLRKPEKVPQILQNVLKRAAECAPNRGIIYINIDGSEDFQSYPQLLMDSERILAGLRLLGLKTGDKIIFQIDYNRAFISCHWACVLGGFIQVPISVAPTYRERNLAVNKLINTWDSLNCPIVITTENLINPLNALATREGISNFRTVAVDKLLTSERDNDWADITPDDVTIFLLTSGSTGKPKLVQQCHHSLISRSAGTVQLNRFTEKEISVNWMPLDHVGGIVMWHIRDVYLTCQQVHVPTQMILEQPLFWLDLIDKYKATNTWAPNFAYGLISDRIAKNDSEKTWDLSHLRSILNGGEAVVAKTARVFLKQLKPYGLPPSSMQPAWGMSETCSGVTHSSRFSLDSTSDDDQFVEVGEAIPNFSMRIVDERNQIVQEGIIGHLQVKGAPVTSGYYNNPKANEEAFTHDGWFDTGDLGIIRDGQLTITGRGKGEIIINGINFYSHEIESVVESIEGIEVSFTAATAVRQSDDYTDKLAIFFHPNDPEWENKIDLVQKVRRKLIKAFGIYADYVLPVAKEDIPKTAIGKIQRSILSKQLMEGEFDELLRKIEVENCPAVTVPDWFYRKVWVPTNPEVSEVAAEKGHFLIFMDGLGLGKQVIRFLEKIEQKYILVDIGEEFAQINENKFLISPETSHHYDQLIGLLNKKGISINTVLHLWNYSAYQPVVDHASIQNAQNRGVYSLLSLIHSLDRSSNIGEGVRLFVATSHLQPTASDKALAYEKSTLPGFLKAAALDLQWLKHSHIDFEMTDMDGKFLLDELGRIDLESEIAYRNGIRMKSYLSKIDMIGEKPGGVPLKAGGLYLITGGLGGVGCYLAKRLMTQYKAKLIIIGRTKLPERSLWNNYEQKVDRIADRIRAYEELESSSRKTGGEFIYYSADISDYEQLETAVSSGESKWDIHLSGVFHLAGDLNMAHHWRTAESHRIISEKRDVFEAMFKAKVYGTWNLFQNIKQRSDTIFIGFSSVVSELGGATFGTYCAANSFLDGCCRHHHFSLPQKVFTFNWSMWEELGMNRDNPQYAQQAASNMGNMIIEPESGWNSLLAGLCRKDPQVFVGLNGLNPHIRSRLDKQLDFQKRLILYVTTPSGSSVSDELLKQMKLATQDIQYPIEIIEVETIPALKNGAIDYKSLQHYGKDKSSKETESQSPKNEAEKKIAAIWKDVLGLKKIRTDINFFDSGGTSIQLAQVNGQLKDAFRCDISMTDLFQFPTISSLGEFLSSSKTCTLSDNLNQSAERAMERRSRMLRRKRIGKKPSYMK